MAERYVSEGQREALEAKGETGYGTSFPMADCDEVRRAIESYGRAPVARRAQLRRAIIRRHAELGCAEPLPEKWTR